MKSQKAPSPTSSHEFRIQDAERAPAFVYRRTRLIGGERVLCAEKLAISKLAQKFGTPLYVYSATTIRERYATFDATFKGFPHTVCYSVKANSNISLLRMLAKLGSGFDVVSGGELERVIAADRRAARRVVFSGVGKTAVEMDLALKSEILLFNLESEGELHLLAERAARLRKTARVALRVNPDVPAETHPYIATGLREHKFGVGIAQAPALYTEASRQRYLDVAGVSVHIGSQITSVAPFHAAMERVAQLVHALREDGHNIRYVDAGGGLGITYLHPESMEEFARRAAYYAEAVTTPLQHLGLHLLLEPGRSVVGPSGALITRVLFTKTNGAKRFLVTDAGYNDLIRPTLYSAYHHIVPVSGNRLDGNLSLFDVVGPVCETGDYFARDRALPPIEAGELIAILDAGAYGMSISSNYNTRPRPAEVLVTGKSVKVIRKRETVRELMRAEL